MPHVPYIGPDGSEWPSVSQIVNILDKPFLLKWYGTWGFEHCEKVKKESAERGTKLHREVEGALQNWATLLPPSEFAQATVLWAYNTGFKPDYFEKHVKSESERYHGTFDCLGTIDSIGYVLTDWKFTKQLSDVNPLQGGGYAKAIQDTLGITPKEFRLIRPYELLTAAKKTDFKETRQGRIWKFEGLKVRIEERIFTNLEHYTEEFLNCRKLWDYLNQQGKWAK